MNIMAVGTWGAGLDPQRRNTTFLIDENTLLDCGPHTTEYLINQDVDLSKIKRMLITHLHLDHAGGIPEFIWQRALHGINRDINITGPYEISRNITEILRYYHTPTFMMRGVTFNKFEPDLKIMPGKHSVEEYMYRATFSGKSVFYSGDTSYTEIAIETGKGCDLFIHEATYPDTMEDEARKYGHSTVAEAIMAFRASGSKIFMPTHMSSESFQVISSIKDKNIIVPEDGKVYKI